MEVKAAKTKAEEAPQGEVQSRRQSVLEEAKKGLAPYYAVDQARERVSNRAMPNNPMEINDWYPELDYFWVPAPGAMAPEHHSHEYMAGLRAEFVQKGWQLWPSRNFETGPGRGLPWLPYWEDDSGRVRLNDHHLYYADMAKEKRRYQHNLDQWNEGRLVPAEVSDERQELDRRVKRGRSGAEGSITDEYDVKSSRERVMLPQLIMEGGEEESG